MPPEAGKNAREFFPQLLSQLVIEVGQRLIEEHRSARLTKARAIAVRCCCPPDRLRGRRSR